jgi:8-oxo-dGTP pyrophosphatase MutT (NUDIX family)
MTKPVEARPAATVLLVRDRDELEVLMVERHRDTYFASALVFPGGMVGPEDSAPHWNELAEGGDDLDPTQRALRIAGFRELHEETGLLIVDRVHHAATAAAPAGDDFAALVRAHDARLDLAAMHRFAHWITPEVSPKRYDTHFYLCGLETEVEPISDGRETVYVAWLTPAKALELAARRERQVLFPTRANLELLAQSKSVAEAIAAASARRIVTITPRIEQRGETRVITIPEDAGYGAAFEVAGRG